MKHDMNFEDLELMDSAEIKKELKKCDTFRNILKDKGIGWRNFSNYGQIFIDVSWGFDATIYMPKWKGQYDFGICSIKDDKITAKAN